MIDILFATDGDIDFTGGDLHWGESTGQHIGDILMVIKGGYATSPTVGVDINGFLADDNANNLSRAIKVQLSRDGMRVNKLSYENGKMNLNAAY